MEGNAYSDLSACTQPQLQSLAKALNVTAKSPPGGTAGVEAEEATAAETVKAIEAGVKASESVIGGGDEQASRSRGGSFKESPG